MPYHVVIRERGPAWLRSHPMDEQPGWREHAAFMNQLAEEGFVALGGPLGERERVLLIVRAETQAAVHARLAADPWSVTGLLRIASIEPWEILLFGNADGA